MDLVVASRLAMSCPALADPNTSATWSAPPSVNSDKIAGRLKVPIRLPCCP